MRNTTKLRSIMNAREAVIVPGVANALYGRIVDSLGFKAIYVSGAGIANMQLGLPDIGLTTADDLAGAVSSISDVVGAPLLVDADTGFGNAANVYRTVTRLEKCGASGIQIEDQIFPKKCGHFAGKGVIPAQEMVGKIKAALDARRDDDLVILARTDARSTEGLEAALERANTYIEAGADATFVEAPADLEELAAISRLAVPQVANIVFGGKTPDAGRETLSEMGFSITLYANAILQASVRTSFEILETLKDTGSLAPVQDRLATFEQRQNIVDKDFWDTIEARYADSGL